MADPQGSIFNQKATTAGQLQIKWDHDKAMEPNTKGSLLISIPYGKPFDDIPRNFSLSLETQYGLMKKKDTVSLQFDIDWW